VEETFLKLHQARRHIEVGGQMMAQRANESHNEDGCREISCESAEVWLAKSDSKSDAYEFRTKSAQSGGLETNGPREREFATSTALSQWGGLAGRPLVIGDLSALKSQRRILDEVALAGRVGFEITVRLFPFDEGFTNMSINLRD
jgi:hypothetical protein